MTSSPVPMPNAISAICSADVPEFTATQCRPSTRAENSPRSWPPPALRDHPERSTASTAARSSPMIGLAAGIMSAIYSSFVGGPLPARLLRVAGGLVPTSLTAPPSGATSTSVWSSTSRYLAWRRWHRNSPSPNGSSGTPARPTQRIRRAGTPATNPESGYVAGDDGTGGDGGPRTDGHRRDAHSTGADRRTLTDGDPNSANHQHSSWRRPAPLRADTHRWSTRRPGR